MEERMGETGLDHEPRGAETFGGPSIQIENVTDWV